jgi:RHS repeat-associated protein
VVRGNFLSEEKADVGAYRYGFNGKEKDSKGEWGSSTHYDYGFRIYKPSIGKFLSVDPLTQSYPMLTPYQFASNTPIVAIDLDGLESRTSTKGEFKNGYWTMGSDNHISLAHEAELKMKAQQAANQKPVVAIPPSNGPTIGPAPQESPELRKYREDKYRAEQNWNNFIEKGQTIDPFTFGAPGTAMGLGFARTTAEGFRQLPGVVLPELAVAKFQQLSYLYKLSKIEQQVVAEVNTILKSSEFNKIQAAYETGVATEISIGGRTILYEPQLPASGFTLFEENAFVIGKEAFKSQAELNKTLLQELYRLNTSSVKSAGVSGASAAAETKSAVTFAEETYNALYK